MKLLEALEKKNLIHPPRWLSANIQFATKMGSQAYGVANDESDLDIYGFVIPPKEIVFPHFQGVIQGFGRQGEKFDQWQEHHVNYLDKEYDFSIFNIVKYFALLMEGNPNVIDSLFTDAYSTLHISAIGSILKDNRKLFLHKGLWPKFKGYAYSQVHKIKTKTPAEGSKRAANVEQFGYDVKFAYHVVRLLNEIEQILVEGDLDLKRNREQLKSIRAGEWEEEGVLMYFTEKERELEKIFADSKIPAKADEGKIKEVLLNCLEHHYGDLSQIIYKPSKAEETLLRIKELVNDSRI